MIKLFRPILKLLNRLRYPASMPEDVADALGITLSNHLKFATFLEKLTSNENQPRRLLKFMPRKEAEKAFERALKQEIFLQSSLFSYYFNEGWMEFELHFDSQSRLRRIWLHHQRILDPEGVEIRLKGLWDKDLSQLNFEDDHDKEKEDDAEEELILVSSPPASKK